MAKVAIIRDGKYGQCISVYKLDFRPAQLTEYQFQHTLLGIVRRQVIKDVKDCPEVLLDELNSLTANEINLLANKVLLGSLHLERD